MSLRVAFQMDAIETVDISTDTSFALAEEAQARGMELFEYAPQHLSYEAGKVRAFVRPMEVRRRRGAHVRFQTRRWMDLAQDVDMVFMRQDPPFDMAYITATYLLERLQGETLVVNDPKWVRNNPEKILPLDYAQLMPPTLISRDRGAIDDFRRRYQDIIFKPLYGNGGAGIFRIKMGDGNYNAFLDMFFEQSREPIMVQAFLKEVVQGDKRIILVDGVPVGAINRIPKRGETRSNLHVGGRAEASTLTARDHEICSIIGSDLKVRRQILVGIDVIDGHLTEINNTSPTGVQELKHFSAIDAVALTWDAIERHLG